MAKKVKLIKMSAADSAAFIPTIIDVFADHLVKTKRMPDAGEASTFSNAFILTHFFPDREVGEDQHLFHIEDEDSGERVGRIWLTKKPSDDSGEDLRVGDIFILEAQRRKGYASAAIAQAEAFAAEKGFKTLSLNVFVDSIGAKELYEKLGFIAVGETKNDEGDVAQYEMSKALSTPAHDDSPAP